MCDKDNYAILASEGDNGLDEIRMGREEFSNRKIYEGRI